MGRQEDRLERLENTTLAQGRPLMHARWVSSRDNCTSPIRSRSASFLLLTGLLLIMLLGGIGCSRDNEPKWLMGYYVGYIADRYPVEAVSWESLTHIAVGAALPRHDGTLDTTFYMSENRGSTWAKRVVRTAREHNVKPILMLGGADTSPAFREAVSPNYRQTFVDSVSTAITEFGFDGVDIDWEPMSETDIPAVRALAEDLRARHRGLILTVPIGSVNMNRRDEIPPSISSLASTFDQINLMTYGMHGAGWRDWHSWHPGALQGETVNTPMSIDSTVSTYLESGLPAHKLGVGIGFYGACYRGITEPNQQSSKMEVVADGNRMSQADIMDHYFRDDIAKWDDRSKTPYLSSREPIGPLKCNFVPYENVQSVQMKARYAVNRGLGGVIVWNINQGHRRSASEAERDILLKAIAQQLATH